MLLRQARCRACSFHSRLPATRLLATRPRARGVEQRQKRPEQRPASVIKVPALICNAEIFAKRAGLPLKRLLRMAEDLGEPIDSALLPLAPELIELLALECEATLELEEVDACPRPKPSAEEAAALPVRPPVVTLMGHVDHGKTSLLDAFRGSNLTAGEAGGITQGISAFSVGEGASTITFIDTPGHELFAAMRRRGANATDVIILVVAVDAGIQPTTVQAIEFARDMGVPLVVAANKMDRPDAEKLLHKLTAQLLEHGVVSEEMGGEVPIVGVSALKRTNLDALQEAVLLQAELLELRTEVYTAPKEPDEP